MFLIFIGIWTDKLIDDFNLIERYDVSTLINAVFQFVASVINGAPYTLATRIGFRVEK